MPIKAWRIPAIIIVLIVALAASPQFRQATQKLDKTAFITLGVIGFLVGCVDMAEIENKEK